MIEHTVALDQEYEITTIVKDAYGDKARDILGTVFAPNARVAVRTAREQFGRGLGKIKARLTEEA